MADESAAPSQAQPTVDAPSPEFGGEVRVGGGPGPRWLRFWYYLVYVWAILYLLIEDVHRYWILATFAGVLVVWLAYIAWKKRPPEP